VSGHTQEAPSLGLGRQGDLPGLSDPDEHVLRGAGPQPVAGSGGGAGSSGASVLGQAAALRFPDLRELKTGRERVDALVEHITATAIARGDLEELRLETQVDLLTARDEWNRLVVPKGTKPAQDDARRRTNPALYERIQHARWLVERCTEGIERMGGSDYDAASRAYTLIAGTG
jgi:hypothetical protein